MGSTHSDEGTSEARVDWLAEQLERHSDLYYNKAEPQISDADFDALRDELQLLSPNHPQLSRVGSDPPPGSEKVDHLFRMMSLDKANSMRRYLTSFPRPPPMAGGSFANRSSMAQPSHWNIVEVD